MKVKGRAKSTRRGFVNRYLEKNKPDRLYIAYGSNLNKGGMAMRCPDAIPVGKRMLVNAKLVFRGVADIAYEPGSKVPVALWKISRRDESNLDRFEGVASGMYRKKIIQIGKSQEALIYLMNDDGVYPPSRHYANTIRDGYKDFGLDESYLDTALAESFDKEPTQQTECRRNRQKQSECEAELVELPDSVAFEKQELLHKRLATPDEIA